MVGYAAFGALHQSAAPSIRRRVADGTKRRKSSRRCEGAASESEGGLQRKFVSVFQPLAIILEEDCLRAAHTIAPRKPDLPRATFQIDVDLEVSHREMIGLAV